ncbi:2-oxoacid:acceptor oxidoreductase subunit alpha [Desulfotomaculum copahuensis]|uniref:2-oxoglutarate ferredoxin oxidoreductase subunit alpha n=1 Tax=Desulfotomaculum copahuensis TaxID=1838280 RepID=A0A1B7LHR2_9FIRM|nr:2-oxoacid:acceptor oxidoreductase subunit alpha [Desulfotomaculum copahuensis]OAT85825.1 2-oxoglutarate ferredoxin oxidoreductase subunit alpha [Desulfotomaculum copahuensis]
MTEYTQPRLMQGNEACVEGALAAGLNFFAGYPITPSTEIAESLAGRLPKAGGVFMQMEDEIASISAVIGASLTGAKAMTATSGPGFSLMQEGLGYGVMAEVPCVLVNVQRLGPSTGIATAPAQGDVMQSRWGTHGDHPVIVITPSSVAEVYTLTVQAFNLAERYRTPVILLMDEVVAHMRESVVLPEPGQLQIVNRPRPETPPGVYNPAEHAGRPVRPMACFGDGYRVHVTGLAHDATGFATSRPEVVNVEMTRLNEKIPATAGEIIPPEKICCDDADIVLTAFGGTARAAMRAMRLARRDGLKVGLLRPVVLWPVPERAIAGLAAAGKRFLVVEMNFGQYGREIERVAAGRAAVYGLYRVSGELITPAEILGRIREVA